MDRMARMVGLGGSNASEKAAAPKSKPTKTAKTRTKPTEKKEQPAKQTAKAGDARPKSEPTPAQQQTASTQSPAPSAGLMSGAQPTVPSGSFDNRFGSWR
jgi:hypothetical protein